MLFATNIYNHYYIILYTEVLYMCVATGTYE